MNPEAVAVRRLVHVVRGDEHRDPALVGQQVHEVPELPARQRIHSRRRLVEKEHPGLVEDRAGQCQPLTQAEGKRLGQAVDEVAEAELRQHLGDAAPPPGSGDAVERRRQVQVLEHRLIPVEREALGHVADVAPHVAPSLPQVVARHDGGPRGRRLKPAQAF